MAFLLGKTVADRRYLHVEALDARDDALRARVAAAERLAGLVRGEGYNLVRLDLDWSALALLHYPGFFDDPFPALAASWLVDAQAGRVSYRTYTDSLNPPILHRKELMLPAGHPRRDEFAALTAACESVDLFDNPRRIGYRRQWEALIAERGYRVVGHALVPLGNDESAGPGADLGAQSASRAGWKAARHLTALTRYAFSAPVQSLARHGMLDGRHRIFDYGCGRGDDVRGLSELGIEAAGWDPYFAPDRPIGAADIVNLGFVVNVIEDFDERLEALTRAWSLAERLLVVSVMLANQNDPRGERFRDGVMTRRGTFQKYFTQTEVKAFLEQVLDEEAIPVAPGVLYVFRDKDAEQRFFVERYRRRRNLLHDPSARVRERPRRQRRDRASEKYAAYKDVLERLWECRLSLGRKPDKSEVADELPLVEGFGSIGKALRFIEQRKALDSSPDEVLRELERARAARAEDLTVYLALNQFERRRPYKHLESGLRRDIKHFFGDYSAAGATGWALLSRIADVEAVEQACREAAEHGLGWLDTEASHEPSDTDDAVDSGATRRAVSLQLDARLVEQLPALLRVYIGAASAAYGDYRNADLVKIHIGSGKLTLMRFDDFDGKPLLRRVHPRRSVAEPGWTSTGTGSGLSFCLCIQEPEHAF